MTAKPKHQRLALVVIAAIAVMAAVLLAMWGLRDRAAYFFTPSDIAGGKATVGEAARLGGMVTAAKKIRARSGSQIMFATIDDLEGAVEVMLFEKTLLAMEGAMALDEIVIVRGRVDHKEGGKVTVVVQDVERFDPSDAEIERARAHAVKAAEPPRPLRLPIGAEQAAGIIDDLKRLFEDYPGESEVVLEVQTSNGLRCLKLGEGYRVAARNASLKAELDRLLGPTSAPPPPATAAPVSAAA